MIVSRAFNTSCGHSAAPMERNVLALVGELTKKGLKNVGRTEAKGQLRTSVQLFRPSWFLMGSYCTRFGNSIKLVGL